MHFTTHGSILALVVASLAATAPQPVMAQDTAPSQDEEPAGAQDEPQAEPVVDAANTIVVTGTRLRGQLDVDQPPIAEFSEEDIAAFGAGSIADVLEAIAPATESGARGGRGGTAGGRGGRGAERRRRTRGARRVGRVPTHIKTIETVRPSTIAIMAPIMQPRARSLAPPGGGFTPPPLRP